MTSEVQLKSVFSADSSADFPFQNSEWVAVAFERNQYDNTRIPQWFFRTASERFGSEPNSVLLIAGDLFGQSEEDKVKRVRFTWEDYRQFMLTPEVYSVRYQMASEDLRCGCWADEDITVFGGDPELMTQVLGDLGGSDIMLAHMRKEFILSDVDAYPQFDEYLQGLLSPNKRK